MSRQRSRSTTGWTRRLFLAAAGAGVAGAFAIATGLHRLVPAIWSTRWALDDVLEPPPILSSELGLLSEAEKQELFELARTIEDYWQLGQQLTRGDLDAVLDLKTSAAPSYLEEYRSAVRIFSQLRSKGRPRDALRRLLGAARRAPDREASAEAHARDWVVAEFLNLALIRGGFARFGVKNYSGYAGGPEGYRRASVRVEKRRWSSRRA